MKTATPLRIFRSYHADYYNDDVLNGPQAYPDDYFDELIKNGFNAVWLRGILRNLAEAEPYPDMGADVASHQDALGLVVACAKRHGVRVLLYFNEPLCLPADHLFWKVHPEACGAPGRSKMDNLSDDFALCTSEPGVKAWLTNAARMLFKSVPDLGGWFLITASEHHTHCYSHCAKAYEGEKPACFRCVARHSWEVAAEVVTLLRDGTRAVSKEADCIAWNWSWDCLEPDPQPKLLAHLPKDVTIMADWERGGWVTMPGGRRNFIDEYSLSYIGPSERFMGVRAEAEQNGLAIMAKLQVGTTHELATVPNLPLIDNLYEKLARAEAEGVTGFLATWNFGNSFSWNTSAVAEFFNNPERPGARIFVERLAVKYFPGCDARGAGEAIEKFSAAMQNYPFWENLLYWGPMNYALAYPLTLAPLTGKYMGHSWVMEERGDNLSNTFGPFPVAEFMARFSSIVEEWQAGVEIMSKALSGCQEPRAKMELGVARMVGLCFRSTVNVYKTWLLRKDRPPDAEKRFLEIVNDEIAVLEAALPLIEGDPRLGFHAECQAYMFSAESVRKKLDDLRNTRAKI